MLLAFAEFDRDNTLERLNMGKAIAKSHGKRVNGRAPIEIPNFEEYLARTQSGEMTVTECCKQLGIGRTTWYKLASEVSV